MQTTISETQNGPTTKTAAEKEAMIYAMARAGAISPRAADHLVFHMARARQLVAETGMTSSAIAEQLNAKQNAEIFERKAQQAIVQALTDARIPPHLHAANFDTDEAGSPLTVTEGNQRAITLCKRLAAEWRPGHKGLTLYGEAGRGKTYLGLAVMAALIRRHGAAINARYISERDLLEYYRRSYNHRADDPYSHSTATVREWFAVRPQFLLLDDLGSEAPAGGEKGNWARGQIMDLIEYRTSRKMTTFVTTNLSDVDLTRMYDDRIASRIYGRSPMITIKGNDWRQQVRPDAEDPFFDPMIDPRTGRPWVRG